MSRIINTFFDKCFSSLSRCISIIDFSSMTITGLLLSAFHHFSLLSRYIPSNSSLCACFLRLKSCRIVQRWRATRAACFFVGRAWDTMFILCCLTFLFISGCKLPDTPTEPNEPNEPIIVEPNEPNEPQKQAWSDYEAQWPIVLNGVTYIHQMRKRPNGRGVEGQFVRYPISNSNAGSRRERE